MLQYIYDLNPIAVPFSQININFIIPLAFALVLIGMERMFKIKFAQFIANLLILCALCLWFKIDLYWYGLAYFLTFIIGRAYIQKHVSWNVNSLLNYVVIGTLLGGKLGYMLIYDFSLFAISRAGMSFHGGLLGVGCAVYLFAKIHHIKWADVAKQITMIAPLGLALGRIANAINNEIPGTLSNGLLAVHNKGSQLLRHPVSIYQAIAEGLVLGCIMRYMQKNRLSNEFCVEIFVVNYAILRFITEHFKDDQLFALTYKHVILSILAGYSLCLLMSKVKLFPQGKIYMLSCVSFLSYLLWFKALNTGQILSLIMIVLGCCSFFLRSGGSAIERMD